MQTFLPYADFRRTAVCLDWRRLGKQRSECKQILNALDSAGGWSRHPATLMWKGHEFWLACYWVVICTEWRHRGYNDSLLPQAEERVRSMSQTLVMPWWLGDTHFHESHQSNLLRKDPTHYSRYGWKVSPDLPYLWPVSRGEYRIT